MPHAPAMVQPGGPRAPDSQRGSNISKAGGIPRGGPPEHPLEYPYHLGYTPGSGYFPGYPRGTPGVPPVVPAGDPWGTPRGTPQELPGVHDCNISCMFGPDGFFLGGCEFWLILWGLQNRQIAMSYEPPRQCVCARVCLSLRVDDLAWLHRQVLFSNLQDH